MEDTGLEIAAFVNASACMLAMPLDDEDRAPVLAAMTRIAAFAADLAAFPLSGDVEIASSPVA